METLLKRIMYNSGFYVTAARGYLMLARVTRTTFFEAEVDLYDSQERDTRRDIYFKKLFCYGIIKKKKSFIFYFDP